MLDESSEPFDSQAFSDRLNSLVLPRESIHAFGKRAGLNDSLIRKYLFAQGDPSVRVVCRIAKRLNVDLNWLCFGDDLDSDANYAHPTEKQAQVVTDEAGRYDAVRDDVLIDSSLLEVIGHALSDEQRARPTPFRRDLLDGLPLDNLAVIRVIGDSMAGTFSDGDTLLLNVFREPVVPHSGIYVLSIDGALTINRLQFTPLGGVIIKNDNPSYESWTVDKEQRTELNLIARVVFAIKRVQ